MTSKIVVIGALLLCSYREGACRQEWSWQRIDSGVTEAQAILVASDEEGVLYAGSRGVLLKSSDKALSWRVVLRLNGSTAAINRLYQDRDDQARLYCSTTEGLYASGDRGETWKRVFRGRNVLERQVVAIATYGQTAFIGTSEGLFMSSDRCRNWRRAPGRLGRVCVRDIAVDYRRKMLWAASAAGLFGSDDGGESWTRQGPLSVASETQGSVQEAPEEAPVDEGSGVVSVCVDPSRKGLVYAACQNGIAVSYDSGARWQRITEEGLLGGHAAYLRVSPSIGLLGVTEKGVYAFDGERWQELSLRLPAAGVRMVAVEPGDTLLAATAQGLYRGTSGTDAGPRAHGILSCYTEGIPPIRNVQEAAIVYAEVHPDKIRKWRKAAANRAWLPDVSVGVNRDVTDLWHWESGSTTKSDDDTLARGRDAIGWDIRLSWDVGGLIWNDDQTNIDVRSRLTAELRADILDEVTKLYFERIRVAMELDALPLEERKRRMDKELRLQELAASLDALTDGYFSSHVSSAGS